MDDSIIIIGGMGPQASLQLHKLVIDGSRDFHGGAPSDYPLVLHISLPVPDFVASSDDYPTALRMVQNACKTLPLSTASAIGIACNTAHLMVDSLPLADTNFVSMLDEVVKVAQKRGDKTLGLLASPQTIRTKLYQDKLEEAGIGVVLPDSVQLKILDRIIHNVIANRFVKTDRTDLSRIARCMLSKGADSVVLGCTELPIVGLEDDLPSIDSLQVLARALLEKNYQRPV
jgi:aspartate racemase